jgi:hypothetical protein
MLIAFLLLTQQAPALEEGATAALAVDGPRALVCSRTGKYLALVQRSGVDVYEGRTLRILRSVEMPASGAGFDEKEETFFAAGKELVRIETAGWKETFRGTLEKAEFAGPLRRTPLLGESLVLGDGRVYYRTEKGAVSLAQVKDGKLAIERVPFKDEFFPAGVIRILALSGATLIVEAEGQAAIIFNGGLYGLAACEKPLVAAPMGPQDLVVCRDDGGASCFSTTTWKNKGRKPLEGVTAAAVDVAGQAVWVARKGHLVGWNMKAVAAEFEYPEAKGDLNALAFDGTRRILYAVDGRTLRSWTLR